MTLMGVADRTLTFFNGMFLTRSYDALGRSTGYFLTDSASSAISAVHYTYAPSGRLATVTDGTDAFTYTYENTSNLLASVEGPVHAVAYAYEPNRDLMTTADNRSPDLDGSPLSEYVYTYDGLGRRDDRRQSGSAVNSTSTDDFVYNSRSEVIGSSNDVETAVAWNPTYTFDKIGNRESSTGYFASSYTTNALNQYTELSPSPSLSLSPLTPVHDADGNLVSDSVWTYTWNNENRLTTATNGSVLLDFTYDYQGRLVRKDDGTTVEVYLYDGWNRIATFTSPSTGSGQTFTLASVNVWGLDLSGTMQGAGGVGGLLKEGNLYPTFDANGNIVQKLDTTGAVVMSVDYDPFGNVIEGTLIGDYAFSTKPLVAGLKWYYYGFRYYDPEAGRWPNRDPIGERGGLNLYGFVGNEPLGRWDVLGMKVLKVEVLNGADRCESCEDVGNRKKVYLRLDGSRIREEVWIEGTAGVTGPESKGWNKALNEGLKRASKNVARSLRAFSIMHTEFLWRRERYRVISSIHKCTENWPNFNWFATNFKEEDPFYTDWKKVDRWRKIEK